MASAVSGSASSASVCSSDERLKHIEMDIVEQFAELFLGRDDAYGTEAGGCWRPRDRFECSFVEAIGGHLQGLGGVGVYPMVSRFIKPPHAMQRGDEPRDWFVKWGCIDFDRKSENHASYDYESEDECHTAACNLQRVLAAQHVTAWIERTKNCGRHVWIFSSHWVPAKTMRRALLLSCGVAGVSTREVNPKQEELAEEQLGNYVRLPYPGYLKALDPPIKHDSRLLTTTPGPNWHAPHTQVVLSEYEGGHFQWLDPALFVQEALATRTSPEVLGKIAAKWQEPKPIEYPFHLGPPTKVSPAFLSLNAPGTKVFIDGPSDGDRSKGLVYIAVQARLSGLGPNQALALITDAAERWEKYTGRPDREKQLMDIVQRAWTR